MESQEELVRGSGKANVGLKHQILQCKVHIILGPNHKHSHAFLHTPSLSALPPPLNGAHPVGPIWAHKSGPTTYFSWTKESHWSWGFGPWPETDLSTLPGILWMPDWTLGMYGGRPSMVGFWAVWCVRFSCSFEKVSRFLWSWGF